jgi:hypothetical protein
MAHDCKTSGPEAITRYASSSSTCGVRSLNDRSGRKQCMRSGDDCISTARLVEIRVLHMAVKLPDMENMIRNDRHVCNNLYNFTSV